MKKHILLFVFACMPLISFCQDYVINLKGDTLRGTVRIFSIDPVDEVRVVVNKKKIHLTALKARAIFFKNDVYHSVRHGQTQKFMKVIKPGYLSLYGFNPPNQVNYNVLLLVKKNGQTMEIPNISFKKLMIDFLSECEPLTDSIKEEKFKRNDLNDIVDMFNNCNDPLKKGNTPARPLASLDNDKKLSELDAFNKKITALETFSAKKDVLDILGDIKVKLEKQETIPSYLYSVLKTHLANQPTVSDDLEKLIALLSK